MASVPPGSGRITYYPNWDLDWFLERHKPSEITDPSVFWICVNYDSHPAQQSPGPDMDSLSSYWNDLVKSQAQIEADDIKAIATATGFTSGKWMVFRKPNQVDGAWESIARATRQGHLGTAAKVSSRSSSQTSNGQEHVICVYTRDFTDQMDVLRVENGLRELGLEGTITYKADIYTSLGIYSRNPWGLKPTIYTSR